MPTKTVWKGAEPLRKLLVPVGSIEPHPANPRRGNLDAIAGSLERFGQMRALAVAVLPKGERYIVAGNHTYLAATKLLDPPWTHVAIAAREMGEVDALAYLVADNRTSDLGTYDPVEQLAALERLSEGGADAWYGTGYDPLGAQQALERLTSQVDYGEPVEHEPEREPREDLGPRPQEVVLLMDEQRHVQFAAWIATLAGEYGTEGTSATVYEAVRRAAA